MEMESETVSKNAGQGSDHTSMSDSCTSAIGLLPPEMLQSIFQFLPFPDVLACREVNKKWKSVATDSVRKRCDPLSFSRADIPRRQRSRALKSFIELITAANKQGDLEDFPVTELRLELNSDFYWIEMDGSTLICQFLEAVSLFVKHIVFYFEEDYFMEPNRSLAIPQDLTFPNLTKITLEVYGEQHEDEDSGFSFIGKIIENSPNIKEFHTDVYNIRRGGAIHRCIGKTGIEQKASLVTSFETDSLNTEIDLEYLNTLGFKLKHFRVHLLQRLGNTEILMAFLGSQSDTLTSLVLDFENENSQHFRELPCLPHLKELAILFAIRNVQDKLPALFYKELLPVLKTLDLGLVNFAADYFVASHMTPSKSVRELILPQEGIEDAGEFIRQVARLFPNLKKLQVSQANAGRYMSNIYEALPGIEELCITLTDSDDDGSMRMSVDDIITGLPERLLRNIRNEIVHLENRNISYYLSRAFAMLERGTTKTLASLENLKILRIYTRPGLSADVVEGADFTELSGVVLKQMKGLQRIDFGVRKYGPIVSAGLKEDLETHGIKLLYRRPPYVRSRTNFIENNGLDSDD